VLRIHKQYVLGATWDQALVQSLSKLQKIKTVELRHMGSPENLIVLERLLVCHQVRYCRPPTLGSTMHHVSVPGSVADTHRANKIDIKNHTFIDNEGNTLQSSYYIAWTIGLIIYIRVLIQRSYNDVIPFLQATWSADVNLIPKLNPISLS
jgi:hypothetical protein